MRYTCKTGTIMNAINLILSSLFLGLGSCTPHEAGSTQIIPDPKGGIAVEVGCGFRPVGTE